MSERTIIHPPRVELRPQIELDWARLGVGHPRPFAFRFAVRPEHVSHVIPHVANTTFVHWLEEMATAHSDALGYTEAWHREHGLIWFVRRHEIDYLAEACEGDELAMVTWVEEFQKTSSPRQYVMFRPADDKVVCRATTTWVLVSRETGRPQRVPPEMAARYLA